MAQRCKQKFPLTFRLPQTGVACWNLWWCFKAQRQDVHSTRVSYPSFFPPQLPVLKQAVHTSNNFKEETETLTSHKQRHICNQEQIRMSREKNIWDEMFPTEHIILFYLQQLPKVLEICEAPSLFLKTLSLLPFPKPCLQGQRAQRHCLHIPSKIKPNQQLHVI